MNKKASLPWWQDNHLWSKKVVKGADGPIMTQFTIIALFGFHIRLHFFHRGDGNLFHSHPRAFISVGLRGAYRERLCLPQGATLVRIVRPGTITVRHATDVHNVEPLRFPCVTLAVTTPVLRQWEKVVCE
jgi:hypothetical protein